MKKNQEFAMNRSMLAELKFQELVVLSADVNNILKQLENLITSQVWYGPNQDPQIEKNLWNTFNEKSEEQQKIREELKKIWNREIKYLT